MPKVTPATDAMSIDSDEEADALIAKAAELGLKLSTKQHKYERAKRLLHAAHKYAQRSDLEEGVPRVGTTKGELEEIATLAGKLSNRLRAPKSSAVPLLDQRLPELLRVPLIENLDRLQKAASGARRNLPKDLGGNPDPHYEAFVRLAQNIYREAGGKGHGAYPSIHDAEGSAGKLIELIDAAIRLGPGERYRKGKSATRKVIERINGRP